MVQASQRSSKKVVDSIASHMRIHPIRISPRIGNLELESSWNIGQGLLLLLMQPHINQETHEQNSLSHHR